jgi:hypothetical protein
MGSNSKRRADLPSNQMVECEAAAQEITIGETRDFEFRPVLEGRYSFEVRSSNGGHIVCKDDNDYRNEITSLLLELKKKCKQLRCTFPSLLSPGEQIKISALKPQAGPRRSYLLVFLSPM